VTTPAGAPPAGPRSAPQRRRLNALPGAVLALVALAVYHGILTPGWAPAGFDLLTYFGPNRHYLAEAWAQGRWFPLWNPDVFLGVPFLANIQNAVLYPPTLLFGVLPTPSALAWQLVLHLSIAGAGMYAYALRAERVRAPGAFAAGAVYMLGGVLTAHLEHLNQDSTLAWTPWLMLAADRLAVRPRARRVAVLAALVALVILAGHTQQAYYSFLLGAIAAGGRLWWRLRRGDWRFPALVAGYGVGGAALGALVAAAQLVPTLGLIPYGIRARGLTPEEAGAFALPFHGLLGWLLPDYLNQQGSEYAGYIGMAAMLLAAFALAVRWRRPRVAFLGALAFFAFWAATGVHGGLYDLLFYALPGFGLFRVPARLLLFYTVATALLAGHGTRAALQLAIATRRRRRRRAAHVPLIVALVPPGLLLAALLADRAAGFPDRSLWRVLTPYPDADLAGLMAFTAVAAAGIALVVAFGRRLPALAWALPVLVLVELVVAGSDTNMRHPLPATIYSDPSAALTLAPASADQRFISLAQRPDSVPLPSGLGAYHLSAYDAGRYEDALRWIAIDRPDIGLGTGHLDADGYDGGILPLSGYVGFRSPLLAPGEGNPPDFATQDLTQKVNDPAWLERAAVAVVVANSGADPNPASCPRCLVPVASVGGMTSWRPASGGIERAWVESAGGTRTPAAVVEDRGELVRVELPAGASGRLVLADAWYPDWSASVDGRPAGIQRYDGFLRAVPIPDGAREVVFTYRATRLEAGFALSAIGLLLLLALTVRIPLRRE
jgi:hypothetical protein